MSAPLKLQNPNNRRPPSERNLEIYRRCKGQRESQKQVAHDLKLSEGRISQIMSEVRAWLANASAKDGELDANQERRLERRVERMRLEHLYGKSLQMLDDFEKPAESTRGKGDDAVTTTREERNARVQALKSCTRLAESLGKIAEREPLPEPAIKGTSGFIRFDHLQQELIRRRIEAEEHGKAPVSGDPYLVMWFLLRMMFGDPVKPLVSGSPLQAAMRKIVETLVEAGAGEESGVGSQESGSGGGCVVAATTQDAGGAREGGSTGASLGEAAAATPSHPVNSQPGNSPLRAAPGAKETKLAGYSLLDGCDPEILRDIVANGWLERFKDGGELHRESLIAASLARENSGEFSAAAAGPEDSGQQTEDRGRSVSQGGWVVAATTQNAGGAREGGSSGASLGEAAAATPSHPEKNGHPERKSHPEKHSPAARGIEVVGSPEWKAARKKWLQERDERVERERMQKIQDRIEREAEQHQRRADADARHRWLEAGRCRY